MEKKSSLNTNASKRIAKNSIQIVYVSCFENLISHLKFNYQRIQIQNQFNFSILI